MDTLGRTLMAFIAFVPLGIVAGMLGLEQEAVFWCNWLAVVPLAPLTTMAALRLAADAGRIKGGLLKAVLGNTTEMIVGITALSGGYTSLVQSLIIGSVLSYSLLFLGCSYLVASVGRESIRYSRKQTSITSALMMVVCSSLVIPTIVAHVNEDRENTLFLSRSTALVILVFFVTYLVFRFGTHRSVFAVGGDSRETSTASRASLRWFAVYVGASCCVALCARFLVDSLDATASRMHLTSPFMGSILLPLASNSAKSVVIIGHARAGQINKAIRLLMTNVLDTVLFITPSLVLLGWMLGIPMDLEFGLFQATVFILAIIVMAHLLQPGHATYFEGAMLMGTYLVIAASFFVVDGAGRVGITRLE